MRISHETIYGADVQGRGELRREWCGLRTGRAVRKRRRRVARRNDKITDKVMIPRGRRR